MTPLFKKLNFKDQNEIFVLNAPHEFNSEMKAMSTFCPVKTQLLNDGSPVQFVLVFVTRKEEIDQSIRQINPLLEGDAVLWYRCV